MRCVGESPHSWRANLWRPRHRKRRLDLNLDAAAFDSAAESYDSQFCASLIGGMMRRAVWARCAARFASGARILEMNCGTGEDALWLAQRGVQVVATDIAPQMLRIARAKLDAAGAAHIDVRALAWEQLDALTAGPFDGALSNFGGLNCVADLRAAGRALAAHLRPGATAILCIMGPRVPWEWLWFLAQGKPVSAFRRLRNSTTWSGLPIRYPSIRDTERAFSPEFRRLRVSAIGALLPPPYTGAMLRHVPSLLHTLNRVERRIETWWPLPAMADHYLLELRRI